MKKIAIISFFHSEASLCLAKYMAILGNKVDFYYITDLINDKGYASGFEYNMATKKIGSYHLLQKDIPEIYNYTQGLDINFFLLRILSFSPKLFFINNIIITQATRQIKKKKYDAINIIGQHPLVETIHNKLLSENIIHTLHEVGVHYGEITTTPLINKIIKDKTKVIFHSKSTLERFRNIEGAENTVSINIPMGKFETILLYERKINLNLPIDFKKTTFLFYGYIKPYKGLDLLLKAYKDLKEEYDKFNLIIAGRGYDKSLDSFANKNNVFILNKYLSNDELVALNQISTVVLLPYKSASQSGIIVNSFMYKKPIIATNVGALNEYITDNENGILVEPNNHKAFADAMRMIIYNKFLLEKLRIGTTKFGNNDKFNWNIIASSTFNFIFND